MRVSHYQNELFNVRELSQSVQKFSRENVHLLQKCSDLYESLKHAQTDHADTQFETNQLIINEVFLNRQNKSLHAKIEKLSSDLELLHNKVEEKQKENEELSYDKMCVDAENRQLLDYIKTLENKHPQKENVTPSTYTLRSFKSEASKALWFAEAYGLLPQTLKCSTTTGKNVSLSLNSSFGDLDEENKHHVRQLLFILDKFGISDAAYYELSMISQELPRKYLIVQERANLNKLFHIERSPGNTPGAYVKIRDEITSFLHSSGVDNDKPVKVKVSGDGASVSRISNFVTISLTFPEEENCSSVNNVRAIGIFKCKEAYDELSSCCAPIFQELNSLMNEGEITVGETKYKLDIFFGGDMKFVQLCLGLNGSTANYACPWCHVHKNDRPDLDKPLDFYNSPEMARTAENLRQNAKLNKFGCRHPPLVNIDPQNVVPDELHLFLRISDVLLKNLIDDCKQLDSKLEVLGQKPHHVQDLVDKIRDCGVPFNVWADKQSGEMQWTSLSGNAYKKLHLSLPDKLLFVINNETHDDVCKIWRDFSDIHKMLNFESNAFDKNGLFEKIKSWLTMFASMSKKGRLGYDKVTPYMHCLLYHIPSVIEKHGPLSKFSGQCIEKLNDEIKMVHQKRTNKVNQTVDDLTTRKRLEFLVSENLERTHRNYTKRDDHYWSKGKQESCSMKRKLIEAEIEEKNVEFEKSRRLEAPENNFSDMSVQELKEKLKSLGVSTKLGKKEKLVALLCETLK